MKTLRILTGSYDETHGIWDLRLNMENKSIIACTAAANTRRNSYLAVQGKYCFAVSETPMAEGSVGQLHSFQITDAGLNHISTLSGLPCLLPHLCVNQSGTVLYTISYGTGEILAVSVGSDGKLDKVISDTQNTGSSIHPKRQTCAHPHSVWLAPDATKLYVCDLGTDEVLSWPLTQTGEICVSKKTRLSVPAGYGPRHMVFSPDGKWGYVLCEMHYHVLVLKCNNSELELVNDISLEKNIPNEECGGGAIRISQDGKLLFCSNRGSKNSRIDILSLNNPTEPCWENSLTECNWPRDFCVTKDDQYLICANQTENTLSIFNRQPGKMKFTLCGKVSSIPTPVCLLPV